MNSRIKCTCGWSWNKSDSSKKDMYICHECGRDNSNNIPKAQDGIQRMSSNDKRKINLLLKETEKAEKDKKELIATGQIKNPRSIQNQNKQKSLDKKKTYLNQDSRSDVVKEIDREKGKKKEFKKTIKPVIQAADVATDIMQLGNFVPHPIGQGIGKIGNILGVGIDAYQAYDDLSEGNYTDAAINAGSVFLPMGLDSKTFRRNSKYLQPGQPLYPFSPQARNNFIDRAHYIEPFNKVKGMTDASLLANRALLGTLGAETLYDIPKQKNGGWLDNYNDSQTFAPEGFEGDGYSNVGRDYSPAWGGQFQNGGKSPLYVESKNDPRYKAYQDSLTLYNASNRDKKILFDKSIKTAEDWQKYIQSNSDTPKEINSYKRLTKLNNKQPKHISTTNRILPFEDKKFASLGPIPSTVYNYKKPQQEVIVKPTTTKETTKPKPKYWTEKDIPAANWKKFIKEHPGAIGMDPNHVDKNDQHLPIYAETKRDKLTPIENVKPIGIQNDFNLEAPLPEIRQQVIQPKYYDVEDYTQGSTNYISGQTNYRTDDLSTLSQQTPNNTRKIVPHYQMGGSIPGAVGFTYARTQGAAPSKGPHRNKVDVTDASAQNGKEMQYYQNGLDWKPKSISQNGSSLKYDSPEYAQAWKEGKIQNKTADGDIEPYWGGELDEVTINVPKKEKNWLEQYRDKIVEENKDAGVLGAIIGTPISAITSLPQLMGMKALTGEMQRPSEAIGFENNEGLFESPSSFGKHASNFVLDVVTDPANLIGAGILTKEKALARLAASQESGLLSNAYKYNPWAFKPNESNWYRQVGKSAVDDALNTKLVREAGEEVSPRMWGEFQNQIKRLQGDDALSHFEKRKQQMLAGRRPISPFFNKGELFYPMGRKPIINKTTGKLSKNPAGAGSADYLIETSLPNESFQPAYVKGMYLGVPKEIGSTAILKPNPELRNLENFNLYKKNWLQGYKGVPKQEQGGIIKDDRGQWDHPGEITRISGGNITMKRDPKTGKTLTEPLLGIADTGEQQWMYPEEDYNFEGANYVTEIPKSKLAKNGIRQEQKGLQNIDNLVNFTNYNKPELGGWLDQYQDGGPIINTPSPYSNYLVNEKKEFGPQEETKLDYDRIAALPATNTGVAKDIPIPVDGAYIVQKGDTLSKIARESGVSVNNLAKVNKIKNINSIGINQKLLLPAVAQTKPLPEKYQDWDVIQKKTNVLNKLSDLSKIVSYHKSNPNEIYSIVDKKNSKLLIYQGDKLLRSYEVGTGTALGDAQTVTKVINGKTNWDSGNKSTGAGIYTISNIDPSSDAYFNLPSFNLKNEQGIEVATSIHGTPKGRRKAFNNNTVKDNRMSNGCINGQCKDLPDMYNFLEEGTKVYILPEDKGNSFEIVDGKPVFRVDAKNSKKYESYIDKTGKTQKGQGVNRTTNTLVYKPIKSVFNEDKFKDDVFTAFDFNDEKEYNKTTKPFVKSLTSNKKAIMQAAQIPSDVYNQLAKMSFGIYGTESNYGDTHSAIGNLTRAVNKTISPKSSSSPDYKSKYETYGADEKNRSVGLTQIRWNYLNDKEKSVLKKLGITSNKDFLDPEKAAIGTTAILGVRYNEQLNSEQKKDIWKHLPTKWNKRSNYVDRVKTNSSYLNFQQLN